MPSDSPSGKRFVVHSMDQRPDTSAVPGGQESPDKNFDESEVQDFSDDGVDNFRSVRQS